MLALSREQQIINRGFVWRELIEKKGGDKFEGWGQIREFTLI